MNCKIGGDLWPGHGVRGGVEREAQEAGENIEIRAKQKEVKKTVENWFDNYLARVFLNVLKKFA